MANPPSDALLHRYLLATASSDEALAVEEAYTADPELFDRLMELDDTLLDRYLDGTLTPDERADYERSFGVFPRRHERVRLMRDVAARTASSRTSPGASAAGAPVLTAGVRRRPAWSWTWGLAAAAVLVLALVALTRQATLQRRLDESVATQAALQRDLAEAQERARRLQEAALANGAQPDRTAGPGTDAGRIVALALAPGLLRDGLPPLTTIPEGALLVRAELVLPATAAVSYRATLTTAAGPGAVEPGRDDGDRSGRTAGAARRRAGHRVAAGTRRDCRQRPVGGRCGGSRGGVSLSRRGTLIPTAVLMPILWRRCDMPLRALMITVVRTAALVATMPIAAYARESAARGDIVLPEPATMLLLGAGGLALGVRSCLRAARRRSSRPAPGPTK